MNATIAETSIALCRALGFDPDTTQRIVITIDASASPHVEVTTIPSEDLSEAVAVFAARYTLVPKEDTDG